jgi:hypothetical protein
MLVVERLDGGELTLYDCPKISAPGEVEEQRGHR